MYNVNDHHALSRRCVQCKRPPGPTWYNNFVFNHVKIQIHVHDSLRWIDNLLHAKILKFQIKPNETVYNIRNKAVQDSLLAMIKVSTLPVLHCTTLASTIQIVHWGENLFFFKQILVIFGAWRNSIEKYLNKLRGNKTKSAM